MKLGSVVLGYCVVSMVLHCLFIAYVVLEAELDCIPSDRIRSVSQYDVAHFLAWGILYFPFLVLCAFYVAFLKMVRSFCCCCWQCCGHNVDGNAATKCKICIDGVFGNPLLFAVGYTLWGVYEWTAFSECGYRLSYGFGLDVVLIAISMLLLCLWYFVRTKRLFAAKQKEHIAQKYEAQLQADGMGNAQNRGGVEMGPGGPHGGRQMLQSEGAPPMQARSYSDHSAPGPGSFGAPQYAHSAHGVGPYRSGIDC